MTTTEKSTELEPRKILRFVISDRVITGRYMDVNNSLVQIRVLEDSMGLFHDGDHTNIHKHYLDEFEDEEYVESQEYLKLNWAQKWFGKHYMGLVVVITCIAAIIWSLAT